MNKADLIAALEAAGVSFDPSATVAQLKALLDAQSGSASSIKEKNPETVSLLIEVTDVQPIQDRELVIVSGVTAIGKEESFPVNQTYWSATRAEAWVKPGIILSVRAEQRIAGKTTYRDTTGTLAVHTKDGLSVTRMNLGSKGVYKAAQDDAADARRITAKLDLQNSFISALQAAAEAGVDQMALAALLK